MRVGFNTQPPEGGWALVGEDALNELVVSTHSRPKAAGLRAGAAKPDSKRFNTQPPEGGWFDRHANVRAAMVSTHSRPKAAGLEPMPQSPF